jgi:hypothetical protein
MLIRYEYREGSVFFYKNILPSWKVSQAAT